ncbi:hypothetical protein DBR06_SOUSAS13710041 [Sousa chinensis]|nr:hypothetical protein DBR06_SOUSAS13710041 [Sousa chinensis]
MFSAWGCTKYNQTEFGRAVTSCHMLTDRNPQGTRILPQATHFSIRTASQKKETNFFVPRNVRCLEYRVKFKVPVFLQHGLLLPGADKVTRAVELDTANISLFRGPVPAALQALPW